MKPWVHSRPQRRLISVAFLVVALAAAFIAIELHGHQVGDLGVGVRRPRMAILRRRRHITLIVAGGEPPSSDADSKLPAA